MAQNDTPKKGQANAANPLEDNPLLRNERENIDKVIGSEGQKLAEKRLAAIKRAGEMPSA
ncbi:MAG TPA: hypothetical protein VGE97_07725 [Nitrososphaera sp.]|jgi:hypothetical protein